jgi:hypothetical protein
MAPRKRSADDSTKVDVMEKIAGLLAAIVIKDMKPDDAAILLDNIGFNSSEITKLLGVGDSYVRQARFRAKGGAKKKAD